MLKKPATKRSRIAAATGSVIATAALTFGGLQALAPTDTLGAEIRHADFTGQFKSEFKPLDVTGQWAATSYEYNRYGQAAQGARAVSSYSETRKGRETATAPGGSGSGTLCAFGGQGNTGCDSGSARSSAYTKVNPLNYTEAIRGSTDSFINFSEIQTKAECTPDGKVSATRPTGSVTYKADNWGANSAKTVNIGAQTNGSQYRDDYKLNRFQNTYVLMELTASWGEDQINKRAFSEVVMTITTYNGSDRRPTYVKFRSECGLFMNDNTGSKGPATTSNGAVPPEVDVELGAEIPVDAPEIETTSALESATGFGDSQDIEHNGAGFTAEVTRELTEDDLAQISTVMDQAASASEEEGVVEGLGWIRRQANGAPSVTLELPSGGYARIAPKIEPLLTPPVSEPVSEEDAEVVSEEVE